MSMFRNFKESFRNLSWSGLFSVLVIVASIVVLAFFQNVPVAIYLAIIGVYFVLVSFRDE